MPSANHQPFRPRPHNPIKLFIILSLLTTLFSSVTAQDNTALPNQPESVTIAGTIQSHLGCSGDWQPECDETQLTYDEVDDIWTASFNLPAGEYEYKAALNGTWNENYGAKSTRDGENIRLSLATDTTVAFFYDHKTHWITDNVNFTIVTAIGDFQSELGCPQDWDATCLRTWLQDEDENGGYSLITSAIPPGDYELKVALNQDDQTTYGRAGVPDGESLTFTVPSEGFEVTIGYSSSRNLINVRVKDPTAIEPTPEPTAIPAFTGIVTAPGSYQSEAGCPDTLGVGGDWEPPCLLSELKDEDGDGVYTLIISSIPEGNYEYKIAINQSWSENYGADGVPSGPNIPLEIPVDYAQVTITWDSTTKVANATVDTSIIGEPADVSSVPTTPDLRQLKAHWVNRDTIAWNLRNFSEDATIRLYYAPEGNLSAQASGISGGAFLTLTHDENGLDAATRERFPHLADYRAFKISPDDLDIIPGILRSQMAIAAIGSDGTAIDATGIQIPGVLDDLYTYDGPLGVSFDGNVPTLRVWAPTAQRVRLHLFDDSNPTSEATISNMTFDRETGVWSITGEADWINKYYLYEVKVYAPSVQQIVTNLVTDPYSLSLAMNSTRSQIVDLNDPDLKPDGWDTLAKPPLEAPEDIVIYELHVRDFSVNDATVPAEMQGTFKAFTQRQSNGMQHLIALAQAGLTHIHLLPSLDCATINENKSEWEGPDFETLATFPPDSDQQQALIGPTRDQDGFNWCYDPYHYSVPEGSYSTDPDSPIRILEFREMVQALNENGLRVVVDVVYNHTNSSGQSEKSVLDRIVPGYYHRLNSNGVVETSTCCANTATEHAMMEKLMVDSVLTWAREYKVDGFRFDLMGHHMRSNMEKVRAALDSLTLEDDGVDGGSIYVYGEGWNFGEVQDNARGVNATQLNMGGVGIGTFNDRLRDAVRGGSPFGDRQFQGFITGLYTSPNGLTGGTEDEQKARLLLFQDQIRVGLAGNLRDYTFVSASGDTVSGAAILYNGSPTGYTLDPQEQIVYVSKHDNETLWDIIQYKQLTGVTTADFVRMQNMGNNIVLLSQGVPFFQAGDDMLRSKSLDRNSYNSGDWFNRLDFTYMTNNWGAGLPPANDNQDRWEEMRPLLANPDLVPSQGDILAAVANFREFLQIRKSSPLFRLRTAEEIQARLTFHNTGPDQIPGLIVMSLSDNEDEADDLDPNHEQIVVLFNAIDATLSFADEDFVGPDLQLHPVLVDSHDAVVKTSIFDNTTGAFTIPARTTAVFVLNESER